MICPHCQQGIHFDVVASHAYKYDIENTSKRPAPGYDLSHGFCPLCEELIVVLREGGIWNTQPDHEDELDEPTITEILYPKNSKARALQSEVPEPHRTDFSEAVAVLPHSRKASAAISRRILQAVLRDVYSVKPSELAREIEEFISRNDVPSYLADAVDAVRVVGNLAAHPMKSSNTGQVVDVEPGEAEWLLDVLEALCDHAFVQPQKLAERKKALNEKLADVGKPPMKERRAQPPA